MTQGRFSSHEEFFYTFLYSVYKEQKNDSVNNVLEPVCGRDSDVVSPHQHEPTIQDVWRYLNHVMWQKFPLIYSQKCNCNYILTTYCL
jgi:hypothetical protein